MAWPCLSGRALLRCETCPHAYVPVHEATGDDRTQGTATGRAVSTGSFCRDAHCRAWKSDPRTQVTAAFLICFSSVTFSSCHHPDVTFSRLNSIIFQFPRSTLPTNALSAAAGPHALVTVRSETRHQRHWVLLDDGWLVVGLP